MLGWNSSPEHLRRDPLDLTRFPDVRKLLRQLLWMCVPTPTRMTAFAEAYRGSRNRKLIYVENHAQLRRLAVIPQGPLASQLARSQAELTRLTTNLAMRTHPNCNSPSSLSNMPLNPPMPARMSSTCEHVIAKISQLLCRKCRLRTATTAESHESASRSGDRVIRLWLRHEASKGVSGYSR